MKLTSVGIEIARRLLSLNDGTVVTVIIGKPERFPDGNDDYYCPFQIVGLGTKNVRYAGGVDAVQALLLALKMIGSILYTSQEAKIGVLSWDGGQMKGDFGFPVPDGLRDLLP